WALTESSLAPHQVSPGSLWAPCPQEQGRERPRRSRGRDKTPQHKSALPLPQAPWACCRLLLGAVGPDSPVCVVGPFLQTTKRKRMGLGSAQPPLCGPRVVSRTLGCFWALPEEVTRLA